MAALVGHVAGDRRQRQNALEALFTPGGGDPSGIIAEFGPKLKSCMAPQTPKTSLAAALLTTESFATPVLEASLRATIVRASALTGVAIDISAGPGRIRPSTARQAIEVSPVPDAISLSPRELSARLLRPCDALRIAVQIGTAIEQKIGLGSVSEDRAAVYRIAAVYNGQSGRNRSADGQLSDVIYDEIVYRCFLYYEAGRLRSKRSRDL